MLFSLCFSSIAATGRRERPLASGSRRMSKEEEEAIRHDLLLLRQEHRDLDAEIEAIVQSGRIDTISIQRMKKRKLVLKDRIAALEDQLLPDIIA